MAEGKDVLESGCGAGLGIGYLARFARKVVGGDIEEKNISIIKEYYRGRPNIIVDLMEAQSLPIPDTRFNLALLYETIYYLKDPEKCIAEAARVLRENGILIVCTVNKDGRTFIHPHTLTGIFLFRSFTNLSERASGKSSCTEVFLLTS